MPEIINNAGNTEKLTKEEYDALVASGHAKNLTVTNDSDFVPSELTMSPAKPADPAKDKPKGAEDNKA